MRALAKDVKHVVEVVFSESEKPELTAVSSLPPPVTVSGERDIIHGESSLLEKSVWSVWLKYKRITVMVKCRVERMRQRARLGVYMFDASRHRIWRKSWC